MTGDHSGCSGHSHDHDHEDALGLSLRPQIDFTRVQCLNEEVAGSGAAVLKLHEERLSESPSVQSPEDDPELLFTIPFTEAVTVHTISFRNASSNTQTASPFHVKLFCDREDLDFETARELPPAQEIELLPPEHIPDGTIDYPVRPKGRFQNISCLSIFVQDNMDDSGEAGTEITYVGIKGKGSHMRRQAVETVYEARGMLKDHKTKADGYGGTNQIS